jgi:poly(A) polymerase
MLRAVRFAASHEFVIEAAAWESICELSPTIYRASPARLYEEIQKLFLLGSARQALGLLKQSGLLAALFPGLNRWVYGNGRRFALLEANLEWLDRFCPAVAPPSPALFFAGLFGPCLEEAAPGRRRGGAPTHQALDDACAAFMEEISRIISIPGRVVGRLRAILALQSSLRRMPPRRPASIAGRPEFGEALAYLRLAVETERAPSTSLEWWNAFLAGPASASLSEAPTDETSGKRRRRRRRRRRRPPTAG